jgi:DNA-binding Xre family transcriptional regulator
MTRLKQILVRRKISQKQLSDMTDIGEYKISQLCTGRTKNINLTTAHRICDALKCTLDEAFGDVGTE